MQTHEASPLQAPEFFNFATDVIDRWARSRPDAPALWWVDATAGLALTLLIVREGIEGIRSARRPDFSGGCGCH